MCLLANTHTYIHASATMASFCFCTCVCFCVLGNFESSAELHESRLACMDNAHCSSFEGSFCVLPNKVHYVFGRASTFLVTCNFFMWIVMGVTSWFLYPQTHRKISKQKQHVCVYSQYDHSALAHVQYVHASLLAKPTYKHSTAAQRHTAPQHFSFFPPQSILMTNPRGM